MNKTPRQQNELAQALIDRLDNLEDYISDYKKGKHNRIKDIASNLRVLVIRTSSNKPLLLELARVNSVDLIIKRDTPPIMGRKSILDLEEFLNELGYASNVPTEIRLSNADLIKEFADQEGAHEDHSISEKLQRLKGKDFKIRIFNLPAHEYVLVGLAEAILHASKPLYQILKKKNEYTI